MTTQNLNKAIEKVAEIQNTTKEEIAKKLFEKDSWTHFLVRQAA
jgi:hypothetical protein